MIIRESAAQLTIDQRIASLVSVVTTGMGMIISLDWIPNDIGKLATLVGILLSVVLIYTHWRKGRIEYKKTQLEIELLKEKNLKKDEEIADKEIVKE